MKPILNLLLTFVITATLFAQTTYVWTGSANNSFSTAGNWSPFRQIGLTSDVLIFETTGSLNVQNVNQVTVGQLIVRNNTSLTLSPSTGNAKVLSINGGSGEDLNIENGSSLTISGNDPKLSIYLNANSTASIFGNLTFSGTIAHTFNANDQNAIHFKSGSNFYQSCPGNIFNTTSQNNVVVFENGSKFTVSNVNALSPFGLSNQSKVTFNTGSEFIVAASNPNILKLNGRKYSDITINENININTEDALTNEFTCDKITVKQNASLSMINSGLNSGIINIKGNINCLGSINFNNSSRENIELHFNGETEQSFAGTGTYSFPINLGTVYFDNDISILRERGIRINCAVLQTRGTVNTNNYKFVVVGGYRMSNGGGITNQGQIISEKNNTTIPQQYSISQNYPNPFNPSTKIDFTLPNESNVKIVVYDIIGSEVGKIAEGKFNSGFHAISFDAQNLSSGTYFYKIIAESDKGNFTKTLKMTLIK